VIEDGNEDTSLSDGKQTFLIKSTKYLEFPLKIRNNENTGKIGIRL
jgi:hypothetical protein